MSQTEHLIGVFHGDWDCKGMPRSGVNISRLKKLVLPSRWLERRCWRHNCVARKNDKPIYSFQQISELSLCHFSTLTIVACWLNSQSIFRIPLTQKAPLTQSRSFYGYPLMANLENHPFTDRFAHCNDKTNFRQTFCIWKLQHQRLIIFKMD
jgi:hypothetical protein